MAKRPARRRDDDDDDIPKRRSRRDDDDDEDDWPRKRSRPVAKSKMPLWIGLGGGAALLLGIVAFVLMRGGSNREGGGQAANEAIPLPFDGRSAMRLYANGDANGHGLAVTLDAAADGQRLKVFPLQAGQGAGWSPDVKVDLMSQFVVSPDGKQVAIAEQKIGDASPIAVYAAGGPVGKFTPYPKGDLEAPELAWVQFISEGRLLTVNDRGGFDVWSVPGFQRQHGQPHTLQFPGPVRMNLFTHSPTNFALSADGGKLVLFNGTGFDVFDTASGNRQTQLQGVLPPKASCNHWAAALSADGSKFTHVYTNHTGGQNLGPQLVVWDTKTGRSLSANPLPDDKAPAGMSWWGTDHLVGWEGGMATAIVYEASSGKVVGTVGGLGIAKLAPATPGNLLCCIVSTPVGNGVLLKIRAPKAFRPGMQLTPTGLAN